MIRKIKISEIDKEKILEHVYPKDPCLNSVDFKGIVVNKPWGYEYLMFQNKEISIWMLYIKKNYSTSMHCHPNKKTSLLLLSGEATCTTLNDKFELKQKDALIFDKGVFHQTESLSENGIFVLETETPSDKTDLFRLKDNYQRELKAYTEKKNITDKIYNYHYLFLENNKDSVNIFGKYQLSVKKFDEEFFKEKIEREKADLAIILDGEISLSDGTLISKADIINFQDLKESRLISPVKVFLLRERVKAVPLSDYVMSFLEKERIKDVFLVSGGSLMHLLESLRINKNINYLCHHHEQAAAMAAEGYAKLTNTPGFAMVTSGPGGTNAITGVAGAWMDSNPLIVISGQAYSSQTIGNSNMRQLGVQEINIVDIVKPITKYAVMIKDPNMIKYHLQKAMYLATHGRPGPVWLDIPVNLQTRMIEEEDLKTFNPEEEKIKSPDIDEKIKEIINLIRKSKRPVVLLGNGVRLGKSEKEFYELIDKLSFPVVTSRNANDLMWEDHPLYAGRVGSFGQRPANLITQNSDLLLSLGSRISLALTGWAYKDFARDAKKIVVDIDKSELEKLTITPDITVNCGIKKFILKLLKELKSSDIPLLYEWRKKVEYFKNKYKFTDYEDNLNDVNIYSFLQQLSDKLSPDDIIITDMGMSFQCTMQNLKLKKGQRLFSSSGLAAMGFGLPGAIGACIGNNKKRTICISGDGGLMMNIQELQTIFHNKLPIKLFIINNKGYTSIRETQRTYFKGNYIASEINSGVSIPDFVKLGMAHNLKVKRIENQSNLAEDIKEVLEYDGPVICDINISEMQQVKPKQGMYQRPDGKLVPRPIEDMAPFLDREEFEKDMIVEPVHFDLYKED